MKKFLPIIMVAIALIGGAAAGGGIRMLTGDRGDAHKNARAKAGEGDDHGDKKGHGESAPKSTYMKFSRQFVAPVIANGAPVGMMILDVNIELDSSISQSAYAEEPRLRDAVMAVLLSQGASGRLRNIFSDPVALDETKAEILAASKVILGDGARSVLIMDIGYQRM